MSLAITLLFLCLPTKHPPLFFTILIQTCSDIPDKADNPRAISRPCRRRPGFRCCLVSILWGSSCRLVRRQHLGRNLLGNLYILHSRLNRFGRTCPCRTNCSLTRIRNSSRPARIFHIPCWAGLFLWFRRDRALSRYMSVYRYY